jgi:Large polyvalent protein associated domain 29
MVAYIDIKETAQIIRRELHESFPGVKFSVRLSRYSMGSHISIGWTDGPSTKSVEAITCRRFGTGFDGMTDSTTHHDSEYQGQTVHFAGSRPSVSRTISPAFESAAREAWDALSVTEQVKLLNRFDFPRWPEDNPGKRLASFIDAPTRPAQPRTEPKRESQP